MHRFLMLALLVLATSVWADGACPLFALPDHPSVIALGSATTALATGAGAVLSNPAGMSCGTSELSLSVGFLYQDVQRHTGAVSVPLPVPGLPPRTLWGGFAVSSVSYGTMEGRTGPSTIPQGFYGAGDTRIGAAVAASPVSRLHVGIGAAWSEVRIADETASAVSLDLGVRYSLPRWHLDLGAACANLATLTTTSELGDLARAYQGAVRWRTLSERVAVAGGLRIVDEHTDVLAGIEYALAEQFSLRLGRVFGHDTAGFAGGFGASIGDIVLSYAVEENGLDLGASHRVGLTWRL